MSQKPGEFIPIARLASSGAFVPEPDIEPTIQPDHGFHAIANLIRRRKLFIAVVVLIGTILTGVAAFVVPPAYTATAQFTFEPTQAQTAAGMLEPVVDTHIATLTSDARLRDVLKALPELPQYQAVAARALSEMTDPTLEDRLRGSLASVGRWLKDAIRPNPNPQDAVQPAIGVPSLDEMKKSLLVRQERRSNVITVSYKDPDPERSSIISNQIVQMHVNRLIDRKREQAGSLLVWIDERLAQSRAELDAADEALRAHVSAHGTPSADAAAGELTAELSRQLGVVRSELLRRERSLERVRALQRSGAPAAEIEAALQDARPGSQLPGPAVAIVTSGEQADRSPAATPAAPTALDAASRQRLTRLEHEVDVFRVQERTIAERIASLQAASGAILTQLRERQSLERRAATAADVVKDLLRQQQEPKDLISTGVQILAQAPVPLQPSSLSPYLYIPVAMIAFAALGTMGASVRERMDRSFRSERELAATLQIACIGLVPETQGRLLFGRWQLPELPASLYDRSIETVAAMALAALPPRSDGKILAVTSSRPDEGKEALAVGIATFAARSQRVLLIRAGAPARTVEQAEADGEAQNNDDVSVRGASFEIRRNLDLGFNCLTLYEIGDADTTSIVGGDLANTLDKLRNCYDYMIIDAPEVFASAGMRILAARVDGVLLAVRWGSTRRNVAAHAVELLMTPTQLRGGARPHVFSALTHVNLQEHAGYHRGDTGEFLQETVQRGRGSALRLA